MLTVHHLNNSRSQRVLWLLEELGVPYEIVRYQRQSNMLAPRELSVIHPLGKSPVITDNGNFILDAHLTAITDKGLLDTQLNLIPGVVENGMFTGIVDEILMASPNGDTRLIELPNRKAARKPLWRKHK